MLWIFWGWQVYVDNQARLFFARLLLAVSRFSCIGRWGFTVAVFFLVSHRWATRDPADGSIRFDFNALALRAPNWARHPGRYVRGPFASFTFESAFFSAQMSHTANKACRAATVGAFNGSDVGRVWGKWRRVLSFRHGHAPCVQAGARSCLSGTGRL